MFEDDPNDTVDGAPSSPGVAEPVQRHSDDIKYPAWQPQCRAVMLETDPAKIKKKFFIAEAAIAQRALDLKDSEDDLEEREAMREERDAMEAALAEILQQHPELKKNTQF